MMKKLISTTICFAIAAGIAGCNNVTDLKDNETKASYSEATISYLGPEGTYTQEASEVFFKKEGKYVPHKTVSDAIKSLTDGRSDYAVIPQENTIGGAVTDYVDTLIATPGVSVTGEVVLTINQNLLVMPGSSLDGIKTVYSHNQGIAQCREWLSKNLPNAEVIEVSSTAEGAKMVSEAKDSSKAAIASAGCANVYGLEVKASAIQNNDSNKTRFYVLSTKEPSTNDKGRMAFIARGSAAYLPALLSSIYKFRGTLITIHDRPLKTELGQYSYLIECEGLSYADYREIKDTPGLDFRFLGCY